MWTRRTRRKLRIVSSCIVGALVLSAIAMVVLALTTTWVPAGFVAVAAVLALVAEGINGLTPIEDTREP
jgi:hypothetical protein